MKNIIKEYVYDDGTCPVTKAALEDLIEIHCRLTALACLSMNGKKPQQTLDDFLWHVHHTNYFNKYNHIEDNTYDIIYYDADAKPGRIDECIITVALDRKTGDLKVGEWLEFGVKGYDDMIGYDLDDVVYTLNQLEQNT